jgi:malate dehydrogenase (oxaloacetate-decarboxylating)
MNYAEESLRQHAVWRGKLDVVPKMEINDRESLSIAYTPGVASSCLEIQKYPEKSYVLTGRWNSVAVITDGTAVLGLGDIGPLAGMPVMEGKCALFKAFGGVNAVPLCINSKDADEIVRVVSLLSLSFGGINLEDISAPRCFEIEKRLKAQCDIPIFHDDQHGTAIVVRAALLNALKVADKNLSDVSIVINGAGAAGISIAKLLSGAKDIILCDKSGAIYNGMPSLNSAQNEMACVTNKNKKCGALADVLRGADVFIGVSAANILTKDMIGSMNKKAIVFAMANPTPEIMPDAALAAGAIIAGTGRSDFPNQINNLLAFPGVFRGALDVRASDINNEMNIAASSALANLISDSELNCNNIIPSIFDPRATKVVADAVRKAAIKSGVARIENFD